MNVVFVLCLIVSQCAYGWSSFAPQKTGPSGASPTAKSDAKRVWHPANYRGLTMGSAKVTDMLRIFGEPTRTEVFDEKSSNPEVWYHYDYAPLDFPGTVRFIVDKATNTIRSVDLLPKELKKDEAIKLYGPDYIITRYDFDECLGNEEAAPIFESAKGAVLFIEYRQRGIAISFNELGTVNEIRYISEPLGSETSKCKK